jgi:hypothetical protein
MFRLTVQCPLAACSEFPICSHTVVVLDVIAALAFGARALAVSRCHVVPIRHQFPLQNLASFFFLLIQPPSFSDAVSRQHVV